MQAKTWFAKTKWMDLQLTWTDSEKGTENLYKPPNRHKKVAAGKKNTKKHTERDCFLQ